MFWQIYNLLQAQQKAFVEDNPDVDGSQSWLAKSTSVMTSASELSSSESWPMSTSASEGDGPAKKKAIKKHKSGSDSDVGRAGTTLARTTEPVTG